MLEVRAIPEAREPTLFQWYEQYQANAIDMDPKYQRRGQLWAAWRKKLLINSILNGYDIPKIYLADFTYGPTNLMRSRKPYAVVDGKQRLETFFEFFADDLALDGTPIYLHDQELNLDGYRMSDLRKRYPELASRYEYFVPTVMSVISDQIEAIQELFVRLNLNVSISGAERRNAMRGPLPTLIRRLSVHDFFLAYVRFPVNRGQDLNTAAKLLLLENEGDFTALKRSNLDNFVRWNAETSEEDFLVSYSKVEDVLSKMIGCFHERDRLLGVQALVPVFYWLVGQQGSNRQLPLIRSFLEQFEAKRAEVRAQLNARGRGEDVQVSDNDLVAFNRWLRTPDDKANLRAMYTMLESRFVTYVQDNPPLL